MFIYKISSTKKDYQLNNIPLFATACIARLHMSLHVLFFCFGFMVPSLFAQTEFASIKSSLSAAVSAGFSNGSHSTSGSGFGIEFSPHETFAFGAASVDGQTFFKEANDRVDFKAAEAYIKFIGRRMEGKPFAMSLTIGYISYYKSSHGYLSSKNYMIGFSFFRDFDYTAASKVVIYPEVNASRVFNQNGATTSFGCACTIRIGPTRHFGVLASPGWTFSEGNRLFSMNAGLIFAN
ncbi:hypothetical protein JNM05_13870 [bacterium]|nr:hypothetical protein [bacterium]